MTTQNSRRPTGKPAPVKKVARLREGSKRTEASVDEFLSKLDHPHTRGIETVRRIILSAGPSISEGIKWNSMSFRTTEFFATINLRYRQGVQLVFHMGAKVRDNSTRRPSVSDRSGLIKWLANERCLVTVGAGKEIQANSRALRTIVREWITHI